LLISKSWNIREWNFPAVNVQATKLGAAVQFRKNLTGIEQALRIEGAFDPLLLVEIDLGKHRAHEIALFHADAVLACEYAADLDAEF